MMSVTVGKLGIVRLTGPDLAELRLACFRRDGYECQECGRRVVMHAPDWAPWRAHMAHLPGHGRGVGGSDALEHVRTLCGSCHMVGEHQPRAVRCKA